VEQEMQKGIRPLSWRHRNVTTTILVAAAQSLDKRWQARQVG